jgi:hypothetical protein
MPVDFCRLRATTRCWQPISELAAGKRNPQSSPIQEAREKVMNRFNFVADRSVGKDLERVIEPLAAYICATEQPKTALMSALAVLFREVEATNSAAAAHFRACLQN